MLIIGCDYHPGFQQVAIFDKQTGEIRQRRLAHPQEAMEFYRGLPAGVLVGIESTGFSGWFERLLEGLGHEVWMGDATQIRASMTRKQKTDKRDAEHMVKLLVEGRFPRIWVPSAADRDARQLLVHRHKLVQWQTQVKNQLQFLALNQGLQLKWRLWTRRGRQKLEALPLGRYAAQRRATLLGLLDQLEPQIASLDTAVLCEAQARPDAVRLMTHPRSRAGDQFGVRGYAGPSGAICRSAPDGQLFRTDSTRTLQRRQAAVGRHQQARQFVCALPAGARRA